MAALSAPSPSANIFEMLWVAAPVRRRRGLTGIDIERATFIPTRSAPNPPQVKKGGTKGTVEVDLTVLKVVLWQYCGSTMVVALC